MKLAAWGIIKRGTGIWLAEKKAGEEIGHGVITGPGGKVLPPETPAECLLRETEEEWEVKLDPHSLEEVAVIDYYASGVLNMRVHNFSARILSGTPHETKRFKAPQLYGLDALPFDQMFEGDRHWLPKAANGIKFRAKVYYRERAKGFLRIEFYQYGT
ncbi:NUDIX domain-containing protein [Candidatus Kaiserbacteria bacterium]|nr:NUDIX domain-containing protein [Candidatus Kaiserbacteria bacterium]